MSAFKNSQKLKAEARASLLGHLTTAVVSIFLYFAATSILAQTIAFTGNFPVFVSILLSAVVFIVVNICANMLRIGLSDIFLKLHLQKGAKVGDILYAFRVSSDTAVKISAFRTLAELVFMLPVIIAINVIPAHGGTAYSVLIVALLVGGLIGVAFVRICFALCPYLFLDFPELPAETIIKGGVKMIRGHKTRLFKLYLSFLPQYVLTLISLGVAGLWVMSYSHAAAAAFYRDLTANLR